MTGSQQQQHGGGQQKRPTVIIYPTVSPETIVIPIVSCILGFPLLALLVICCLRRRAKLARERDRRRAGTTSTEAGIHTHILSGAEHGMHSHILNCETEMGPMSLARFSPMHKLGVYLAGPGGAQRARAVSLRSERAMSRNFPSLELDTVVEEPTS